MDPRRSRPIYRLTLDIGQRSKNPGSGEPRRLPVLEREHSLVSPDLVRGQARPRSRIGWLPRLAAIAALLAATPIRADAPLTTADLVRFLTAGISEHTILIEVQSRGFSDPLDPARETTLREAGATETLIVAVRRVVPPGRDAAQTDAPHPTAKAPSDPLPGEPGITVVATSPRIGVSQGPTFASRARTVRVPVSVLDKSGAPVLDLTNTNFRISENGKRRSVTLFSKERRPLRIALALDLSRSMNNKIRHVEEALKHFIDLLEPDDEIMVITFNDHVRILQDLTSDRARLERVLGELEPDGGTALYDAAYEAIKRVANAPVESKAVVLVTDGVDTASATTFDTLRDYARHAEVPVYSIGLDSGDEPMSWRPARGPGGGGRPSGPPPGGGFGGFPGRRGPGGFPGGGRPRGNPASKRQAGFDGKPLTELAADTGGTAEVIKGLEHYMPGEETPVNGRLKTAVETIATTLRHRYLVGYEPADGSGGWRTIHVDVDRPTDAVPRARKGYYAGS